ncbi:iron chelate uptake ABC transporter family permease subunit [Marinomonas mediterranea]|jgi:ABC-type enterochelin transport system, permease component|uniref:ABC-type transporter, integral membrane subunit n=1 Tax=Marinomonas mediterranea (strain ATCC 700492 / JCM 21426 / NBRC 103028 / MMB-1) TaxID=717774 RepID=F2JYE3_MARM1|nr:iron chelate uptake ABC transporter family permease subunit [Marinomonas mediterranea]ADZ91974.1 ABC-type transporter, integral membrane subunit [Marinomonas mediterranea MMB-1]WCN18053.1 iron chelate uptake ABC transporter family permease subunit [Marinomonas mediterranea MMB-1]
MSTTVKIGTTLIVIILLMIAFVFIDSGLDFDYIIPKRLVRLATIILASICLAVSAIVFQTIVGNRILVPSVMGYEAVYLLWQALLLFLLGAQGQNLLSSGGSFIFSLVLMLSYSWALHAWLLPRCKQDIFKLLLFGLVLTMVISTATQYIQLSISPSEFSIFQGLSYTSFNRSKSDTLLYGSIVVLVTLWFGYKKLSLLDVMALGREQSMSLGVDHRRYVKLYLALIAILVAVSTSLVGPTAFMGVFVANIAYALASRHQHKILLPLGCAISIVIFLTAQLFVEHVFNYKTSVSILVNLVCGTYFILLIVRSRGTS